MEVTINYPSTKYIARIKGAINKGEIVNIRISNAKVKMIVKQILDEFNTNRKSKSFCFCFLSGLFKVFGFLTGHFYALAAEYGYSYESGDILIIKYKPGTMQANQL